MNSVGHSDRRLVLRGPEREKLSRVFHSSIPREVADSAREAPRHRARGARAPGLSPKSRSMLTPEERRVAEDAAQRRQQRLREVREQEKKIAAATR